MILTYLEFRIILQVDALFDTGIMAVLRRLSIYGEGIIISVMITSSNYKL